jgi:hypothetical protein
MILPPELLLKIHSWLSVRNLWHSAAPVSTKWSILAKHTFFWKEMSSFSDKEMVASHALICKLLCGSPLLRRLILRDRHESVAILWQDSWSNQCTETAEMEACRGSLKKHNASWKLLNRILRFALNCVTVKWEFYWLLGHLERCTKSINIGSMTRKYVVCFQETC